MRNWTTATCLLAALLAACSNGLSDVGPLGPSGGQAHLCTPVPGTAPVVFGNEVLRNDSSGPVTIEAVRLVEPEGLTLTSAFVLPIQGTTFLGTTANPTSSAAWSEQPPPSERG